MVPRLCLPYLHIAYSHQSGSGISESVSLGEIVKKKKTIFLDMWSIRIVYVVLDSGGHSKLTGCIPEISTTIVREFFVVLYMNSLPLASVMVLLEDNVSTIAHFHPLL